MILEYGIWKCIHCGQEGVSAPERHRYIMAHKEEILADLEQLGREKTCTKWRIARSTLWGLERKSAELFKSTNPVPAADPIKNGLPPLPAFSDSWPAAVQKKWLDVYQVLAQPLQEVKHDKG